MRLAQYAGGSFGGSAMRSTTPVSPFPPRSGLAGAIDDAIARLVELRQREICAKTPDEDSPTDLRALADLARGVAAGIEPLVQKIAAEAGHGDRCPSWQLEDVVDQIVFDADRIADERQAGTPDPNAEHRLSGRQLGVGRFS
jgi:hypothetical protein